MSFNIRIPYVIATHLKKFSSTSALKNKSKAAAFGVVSNIPYFHDGTAARQIVDVNTAATLVNKTLTSPVINDSVLSGTALQTAGSATLTAAQSGSVILFDRAAGIIFTLPAPVVGLNFTFLITVTITSNNAKVITDAGTTLLTGTLAMASDASTPAAAAGPKWFTGNGTTHLAVTQNGTTSGGAAGTYMNFTCVTSTLWFVTGIIDAPNGQTIVTPFATS